MQKQGKQAKAKGKNKAKGNRLTMLVILDGFGLADKNNPGNAVTPETAPYIFECMEKYPDARLKAHGKDVGLFPDQEGNSEAGHLNIGTGRIVEQDSVTIANAIANGKFFKNTAFREAVHHVKKYKTAVHVMGLLTGEHSAHAHPDHLYALLEYFRKEKVKNIYLHLFTDGRDAPPHAAIEYLKELRKHMKNGEKIASIIGRFYAMDRNKVWERTRQAYDTMVLGKGTCSAKSAEEAGSQSYNRGETDEYICPTVILKKDKPVAIVEDNDAIFFFNARSDRARQLTKTFVQTDFHKDNPDSFHRKRLPKNIRFVAMSDFGPDLPGIFTAYPSPDIENALAKAIGEGRNQLYISETEKYAHVTYFMNGGFPEPINGEDREMIKSDSMYSYADKPQMNISKLSKRILQYISKETYGFICVNFPNPDMVGHTGDFEAAKKAVSAVDQDVKKITKEVLRKNGQLLVIADHGNAEEMINMETGGIKTAHTTNPVPCILVSKDKDGIKMKDGRLADVAPTILKMMGLSKPKEMTGKALF